ncbi:hypothetical protein IT575_02950 [bacterium]|nr:hypothetical protein [bacterium]
MRKLTKGLLAVLLALVPALLCAAASPAALQPREVQTNFLIDLVRGLFTPDIKLVCESYPEALPNDGRSESLISVHMLRDGKPLAGVELEAQITAGDGLLRDRKAVTDDKGLATFRYQAGIMPQPGELSISTLDRSNVAELKLPLAPVSYLDVDVITPEEYAKLRARQTAAAPIYKLELSGFPEQLAADGGSQSVLTATLSFPDGKPAPGVPLKAEILSGDGSLRQETQLTDAQGRIQIYFTAGRTVGTATVRVFELSTGLAAALNITLVEDAGVRIELLYQDPQTRSEAREGAVLPADGVTGLPLVARVTDLNGQPLHGVELKVEILDDGAGRVEMQRPASDGSGRVEFTFYAGMRTGMVRLRAYAAQGLPESS